MRTVTFEVYSYDELSDEAKKEARSNFLYESASWLGEWDFQEICKAVTRIIEHTESKSKWYDHYYDTLLSLTYQDEYQPLYYSIPTYITGKYESIYEYNIRQTWNKHVPALRKLYQYIELLPEDSGAQYGLYDTFARKYQKALNDVACCVNNTIRELDDYYRSEECAEEYLKDSDYEFYISGKRF